MAFMGLPSSPTPDPEPEPIREIPDELAKVVGYRIEVLVKEGFDLVLAGQLAAVRDFDLHRALDLLHAGCTPKLIYDILR